MIAPPIPIQNIYFLLCYAWNHLQETQYVEVRSENCDRLWDLLAKVLIRSSQQLVKRGLHRDYQCVQEQRMRPKGKILFSDEIRHFHRGHLVRTCEFDELSADVLPNRIIKATIDVLRRCEQLSAENVRGLKEVALLFGEFTPLRLEAKHFRLVQIHRNMRHYRFVLDVCELIYRKSLPTTDSGGSRFRDFTRDEATMGTLFEEFVRNFMKREQSLCRVSSPQVPWDLDESRSSERGRDLLPRMKTDICLEGEGLRLVVDCKFYSQMFQSRFDRQKFISAHLYQLFAYLKNMAVVSGWERCAGILLYPTTTEPIDETICLQGHEIRVVTLNLNQHWAEVSRDLLALVPSMSVCSKHLVLT